MKKSILYSLTLFSLILILGGCSAKETDLPNTYVEGSDYQYMQNSGFQFFQNWNKGEKGYYFLYDHFIYFLDEETETIVPLCNRPDCLHDKETSKDKKEQCNAYADNYMEGHSGIAYCNGSVYYLANGTLDTNTVLYRLAEDGSEKEQIFQWEEEDKNIMQWIVHRDIFYYVSQRYITEDGTIRVEYKMNSLPLTGSGTAQSRDFFTADPDIEVLSCGNIRAYGNYLYFTITGMWIDEETGEGDPDAYYIDTFVYDISNDETRVLRAEDFPETPSVPGVTFWQDRLLFSLTGADSSPQYSEPVAWYTAALDGSDLKLFRDDVPYEYNFSSDGKYLYMNNSFAVDNGLSDEEEIYLVYDSNGEQIDSFRLPFDSYLAIAPGDPDRYYSVYYTDDSQWGVMYWDKSGIGSYHGNEFQVTDIPYGPLQEEEPELQIDE